MSQQPAEAVDFRVAPPKLTATALGWQAWWEDFDGWDGYRLYADLDTAKRHAAIDYVSEEYGWLVDEDSKRRGEAPDVTLTWVLEYGRWHLLADGEATNVQLYRIHTYAVVEPTE